MLGFYYGTVIKTTFRDGTVCYRPNSHFEDYGGSHENIGREWIVNDGKSWRFPFGSENDLLPEVNAELRVMANLEIRLTI